MRLRRQLAVLAGGRGAAAGVSFAWLLVAARVLELGEFGDLALVLSVGALCAVLADGGWTFALAEAVARNPAAGPASYRATVRCRLVAGLAAAVVVVAVTAVAGGPPLAGAVFGVSLLATAWHTSAGAAQRARGAVRAEAANELASRVVVLAAGTAVLLAGGGVVAVVAVYAAVDCGSAVVLHRLAVRALGGGDEPADPGVAPRAVLPLGVAAVLGAAYHRVDVVLLALLTTAGDVALYTAAFRLFEGLLLPAGALSALVVPRFSTLDVSGVAARARRIGALATVGLAVPAAAVALAAGPLLRLTFGPHFAGASTSLVVLMAAVLPSTLALVLAPAVGVVRRNTMAVVSAGLLALNVALNLVLVPRIGLAGAAWATLAGQVAFAAALLALLRSHADGRDADGDPWTLRRASTWPATGASSAPPSSVA